MMETAQPEQALSLLDLADRLISYARERGREREAAAQEFLLRVIADCDALVRLPTLDTDEAELIHARIRDCYDYASAVLPFENTEDESTFYCALSSARMYFWARHYETLDRDELVSLLRDRQRRMLRSEQVLTWQLLCTVLETDDADLAQAIADHIAHIKRSALADVARLRRLVD